MGSFIRLRPSENQAVLGTHGNGLFMLGFPASALPVEFLSFNGTTTSKGNMLNWATTEEVDNSGFDVERSDDGQRFEQVAFVPGQSVPLQRAQLRVLRYATDQRGDLLPPQANRPGRYVRVLRDHQRTQRC